MKQRVITGAVFTCIIAAFVVPGYYFPLVLCLMMTAISFMAAGELQKAVREKEIVLGGGRWLSVCCVLMTLFPFVFSFFRKSLLEVFSIYAAVAVLFSFILVVGVVIFSKKDNAFQEGITAALIFLYVTFPMASANILLLFLKEGWFFLVLALFSPWISDVFAFFTGVLFGKHKIVPKISPKKTWEGCIGGAFFCSIVTMLYFYFVVYPRLSIQESNIAVLLLAAGLGFLLSFISQLGDWLASAVKRWCGIKDFGTLLPGHGGIIDRFDSAFFTLPLLLLLAIVFHAEVGL